MEWKFEKPQDIMKLADHISSELMKQGKHELASEINQFCSTIFTTSSDFLGEFRMLMKKYFYEKKLSLIKRQRMASLRR